jgi:murein L,D-transpeptidase YafK
MTASTAAKISRRALLHAPSAAFAAAALGLAPGLAAAQPFAVDKIVVRKGERYMLLLHRGEILRSDRVALGGDPLGHKRQRGDRRTPEGAYVIEGRNPQSRFHLSLRVSYPAPRDRRSAAARGVDPGGDIYIHGLPNGLGDASTALLTQDWTDGCIAVSNPEIREIYGAVRDGTPILILP